jgi:hypothetical protein
MRWRAGERVCRSGAGRSRDGGPRLRNTRRSAPMRGSWMRTAAVATCPARDVSEDALVGGGPACWWFMNPTTRCFASTVRVAHRRTAFGPPCGRSSPPIRSSGGSVRGGCIIAVAQNLITPLLRGRFGLMQVYLVSYPAARTVGSRCCWTAGSGEDLRNCGTASAVSRGQGSPRAGPLELTRGLVQVGQPLRRLLGACVLSAQLRLQRAMRP